MSVKGKRSVLIRCDCAGGCTILGLDWYHDLWEDGSYNDWFAEFYRSAGKGTRWYHAKKAWQVLWGREDAALDDLVVSHADAIRLRDFLNESLAEHDVLLSGVPVVEEEQ